LGKNSCRSVAGRGRAFTKADDGRIEHVGTWYLHRSMLIQPTQSYSTRSMFGRAMLCCAVPFCAVLCYAILLDLEVMPTEPTHELYLMKYPIKLQ
jgi:hypothetical protein